MSDDSQDVNTLPLKTRIFIVATIAAFAVLMAAIIGLACGVEIIPLKFLRLAYESKLGSKGTFGVLLALAFIFFGGWYFFVANVMRMIIRSVFKSAERAFLSGNMQEALAQYEKCQRLVYLTRVEEDNILHEIKQRIHSINSRLSG